ncbi:amidinotransferase [Clostridium sp. D2Q-14]|uniref:dimethylarginine dimethylaminohydrolase family protein n=1 Tax=Anaeromonas gelatinilytica TaxID=2683194 RepID=UPI00193BB784|nr:arginine deiminase family protein [Anaeromonas gelatinilytica]MBS4535006.1 amidinotransferase [Anaeromonas gelatinilytica]
MKYLCQSMVKPIKSILIKHPEDAFISQENLNNTYEEFNYIGCPDYEKVLKEYQSFESIINENVENVYYLPKDDNTGLDSIYAHDTAKITKKGVIYFTMGKDLRRGEPDVTRKYLESIGIPTLGSIKGEGKMEGGDVVWLDEKIVAVGRGYRTNDEGIRQFKELVKDFVDEVIVVPLPHGEGEDECLHLMSIISMVDQDLAVVYSKFMPVFFREYLQKKGVELIEVNDKEYEYLGSNVLALAPRKCLLLKGNHDVKKKLLEAGAEVLEYEGYDLSYRGTGGPTCLTMPLFRD